MTKFKKLSTRVLSLVMVLSLCCGFLFRGETPYVADADGKKSLVSKVNGDIYNDLSSFFDDKNVSLLPSTVADDSDISVIVAMSTKSTVDAYAESGSKLTVSEYLESGAASSYLASADRERTSLIRMLDESGIAYTLGTSYDNVVSGFEITVKASDFYTVEALLEKRNATAIVGDVYESMESQVVYNSPYIDENSGIFKIPDELREKEIDGRGVVVAVLDTGLDYTHAAFDDAEFSTEKAVFKDISAVAEKLDSSFNSAQSTKGLTASDVWVNKKIPYAYDYADKDPDVLPINSEHGTHVAGIIAGEQKNVEAKDGTMFDFSGVAPGAQLAIMKVFSDMEDGAKTSWLIAALDDCIKLGVDVINMSLGSSCGFTRQEDKANVEAIYNSVKEAGISLIAAASNDNNATRNSEKNGNNGLTTNPDSGTVGSPSTYDASLSVASVDGVKTSYFMFEGQVIYFTEASTTDTEKKKDFISDVLLQAPGNPDSYEFEYVKIGGIGAASDYASVGDLTGKIALVERGTNTFEEKVRIALQDHNAAGIIIYNNVSGDISMSVGDDIGAVCSLSQDDGKLLAANTRGKITISKSQKAGPFMSDFSSWGPTSDLRIKPEITAHGGEIYSAVPGGKYESLSGTSMAAPNQAGATALVRQYVKFSDELNKLAADGQKLTPQEITKVVNQLMMSTADILNNKDGLAYAVRKQGAGLMSLKKSVTTSAFIVTYENGNEMDKSKLEIGDDEERKGVYTMTFGIRNFGSSTLTYDVGSIALTEGVSTTYTTQGNTTVTMNGYALSPSMKVQGASANGNTVTVKPGETAKVTVTLTLGSADKAYLEKSFKYGMYVEGFITLKTKTAATVDMNVPFLGFYGNWTEAPVFDEEYYDTDKDELNKVDLKDRTMADAYATRVIGGLYSDYIATLGAYYFRQDPRDTPVPANKEHIAISNQVAADNKSNWTISSVKTVYAGLLRNAKKVRITATEDATGREVYSKEITNQYKSYNNGGSIRPSAMDVEFSALELNLKNNTRYNFVVEAYIDYGTEESQKNVRNRFEFPVYVDFEAPVVSDVQFRTQIDSSTKKRRLYADLYVYDNHYAMALQVGEIVEAAANSTYAFAMESFGSYLEPVYSSYNSTTKVEIELTDYIDKIKNSRSINPSGGSNTIANSFVATCYDYAMNAATYEIKIPDEVLGVYFDKAEQYYSPNQKVKVTDLVKIYPTSTWTEVLDYKFELFDYADADSATLVSKGDGTDYVDVLKGELIAKKSTPLQKDGAERPYVLVTAVGKQGAAEVTDSMKVYVYSEGEDGYKRYGLSSSAELTISGYETLFAFYNLDSDDREIGFTGSISEFASGSMALSMYPSEKVKLNYKLESIQKSRLNVTSDERYVKVSEIRETNGEIGYVIEAVAKTGNVNSRVNISLEVYNEQTGKYELSMTGGGTISVKVKDPFKTQAIYLMNYRGAGETIDGENNVVVIPDDKGITTIYDYAFSGYRYVEKDLANGDVITDEDPYYIKQKQIGNDVIKKVVVPYGVTTINKYAFAYLTALEEIVLPSTLTKIGVGAFMGCNRLTTITYYGHDANGQYVEGDRYNNLQFINKDAFKMAKAGDTYKFDDEDEDEVAQVMPKSQLNEFKFNKTVAIGTYAFANTSLNTVNLNAECQSIAAYAFSGCSSLQKFSYKSDKLKLGTGVFSGCSKLNNLEINADVVPAYAFLNLSSLKNITLGKDVAVINELAFAGCGSIEQVTVNSDNANFTADESGKLILTKDGSKLVLVVPGYGGTAGKLTLDETVKTIGRGAFSATSAIKTVVAPGVTSVEEYAFYYCSNLEGVTLGKLEYVGAYSFARTKIAEMPELSDSAESVEIGDYAFAQTNLKTVDLSSMDNLTIGEGAFSNCSSVEEVKLGNDATIGAKAFFNATAPAFEDYTTESEMNNYLGTYFSSFYEYDPTAKAYKFKAIGNSSITSVTLGENTTVGDYAFAGNVKLENLTLGNNTEIGNYAFYNDVALATVSNLESAIAIGDYAFSGRRAIVYTVVNVSGTNTLTPVYDYVTVGGKEINNGYLYTSFAPSFASANVSGAKKIGIGAFAYNAKLISVTLGDDISARLQKDFDPDDEKKVVPYTSNALAAYAFAGCTALESVTLPDSLGIIDEFAFCGTGLKTLDLNGVKQVNASAFANTPLTSVNFGGTEIVGDNAFFGCTELETADLSALSVIGDKAFYGTNLESVKLTELTELGSFAFGESAVTSVTFGDKLVVLGDNPFVNCEISSFGKYQPLDGYKNGETELVETYAISDKVFVEDGVLYATLDNGKYELVSYPLTKSGMAYAVKDGTVRITARAFYGTEVISVTLPYELKNVGDKAFFGCDRLSLVEFKSLSAPVLEEEYDDFYHTTANSPYGGLIGSGLNIVKYYMWNMSLRYNNYYYGANFVDYVGKVNRSISMISPENGRNYDSFIYGQYFNSSVKGRTAPYESTLAVIAMIKALPSSITLDDEAAVVACRQAYNDLSIASQQALVTNYSDLTRAERLIAAAKNDQKDSSSDQSGDNNGSGAIGLWIGIPCVLILVAAGVVGFIMFGKKKNAGTENAESKDDSEKNSSEAESEKTDSENNN